MPRRVFSPRLLPTLFAALGVSALTSLGFWQIHRGAEKEALFRAFAQGEGATVPYARQHHDHRYQHVTLDGHYDPDHQILLDNMTHQGQVGYRVLTPFILSEGTVLVDRGWILAPPRRDQWPEVTVSSANRTVKGRIDELPQAAIVLEASDGQGWPRRLSYPDQATVQRVLGTTVEPSIILLDASNADGYTRDWRPGGLPPERHYGYAVQWFGLAAALLAIYVVVNFKRASQS